MWVSGESEKDFEVNVQGKMLGVEVSLCYGNAEMAMSKVKATVVERSSQCSGSAANAAIFRGDVIWVS